MKARWIGVAGLCVLANVFALTGHIAAAIGASALCFALATFPFDLGEES